MPTERSAPSENKTAQWFSEWGKFITYTRGRALIGSHAVGGGQPGTLSLPLVGPAPWSNSWKNSQSREQFAYYTFTI